MSEHLQVLRKAKLVREEPRGRERFYHLDPRPLADVEKWLAAFETRCWVDGPGQPPDRVDPAIRERVHDWILTTYQQEKNEGKPQRLSPPANDRLDELQLPTLVMVGDLDERTTQLACRHLADAVPGARLEEFHDAAHMLNLEQPEKFTRLVLDFLGAAG